MHHKEGWQVLLTLIVLSFFVAGCAAQEAQTPPEPTAPAPGEKPTSPPAPEPTTTTTPASSATNTPSGSQATAAAPSQPETAQAAVKEFDVSAKKWSFDPSTITVNKGDTVKLHITSEDVTHGFSLPEFSVSDTLSPGTTTTVEFIASKTGTFSFFCSMFCGSGHGSMRGTLIVT